MHTMKPIQLIWSIIVDWFAHTSIWWVSFICKCNFHFNAINLPTFCCPSQRRFKTALFWSEKVVALSEYDPKDIYWQAHCMFMLREYHRAAHIIKHRGLEKTNIFCHYLLVECLFEAKEFQDAIDLLNSIDLDYLTGSMINGMDTERWADDTALQILSTVDSDSTGPTKSEILASICLLKGRILEAMDNRTMAMDCYVEALHLSVYCTEALDALVQHESLLASEENELIIHLPVDSQCTENEKKILMKLYTSKLKKYHESALPVRIAAIEIEWVYRIRINILHVPSFRKRRMPQSKRLSKRLSKRKRIEWILNFDAAAKMHHRNSLRQFNRIWYRRRTSEWFVSHSVVEVEYYCELKIILFWISCFADIWTIWNRLRCIRFNQVSASIRRQRIHNWRRYHSNHRRAIERNEMHQMHSPMLFAHGFPFKLAVIDWIKVSILYPKRPRHCFTTTITKSAWKCWTSELCTTAMGLLCVLIATDARRFIFRILKTDPYHCKALTVLVGCLMELKEHTSE